MPRITCNPNHFWQEYVGKLLGKNMGQSWDNIVENHGASAIVEVSYWMWWIPGWIGAT
jgi:hypothetical protein